MCFDVGEKERYLRRVRIDLFNRLCRVDSEGAPVHVDHARVPAFDAPDLVLQVHDLAAMFRWHQVIVVYVPIIKVRHVLVWFWGVVVQCQLPLSFCFVCNVFLYRCVPRLLWLITWGAPT